MRVILRDTDASGSIEVWTRDLEENVKLMFITAANVADMYTDCMAEGQSELIDHHELAARIVGVFDQAGLEDTNAMYRAVMTFIEPGPPYTDDQISFEV